MDVLVGKGTEHRQGLRTSTARGAGQPQGNVEVGTVEERLGQHPTSPVLTSAQDLVKALAQRPPVREGTHPHPNPCTPHENTLSGSHVQEKDMQIQVPANLFLIPLVQIHLAIM